MERFPQVFDASDAPRNVLSLVDVVVPQLLAGGDSVHAALREQYSKAHVGRVELSGAGFFVHFAYDTAVTRVCPANFAGGDAHLDLGDGEPGAGCLVFISDGLLSTFEVYMYGTSAWTAETAALDVTGVMPVPVPDGDACGAT